VVVDIEKKLVVGLRVYLVKENFEDAEAQLAEVRGAFPDAFVFLASCGLQPSGQMRASCDEVSHYSETPEGLGVPNKLIVSKAIRLGAKHLVLLDLKQFVPKEIRGIYSGHLNGPEDVVIPERKKRFLFMREELHGPTVEDLLNGFLRLSSGCKLRDPVSGAFIFYDVGKLEGLGLDSNSWVGDFALVSGILGKKLSIAHPPVSVRENTFSISNRNLVFNSFLENEKFFGVTLGEVAEFVKTHADESLFGGNFFEVDRTAEAFVKFKSGLKIKGMKALVLAGGKGTRLKPFTHTIQKQLFPVANKPILHFIIEKIVRSGISDIGVIVGPNKEQVKESLGDGSKWNCRITYIEQDRPGGLAHAVLTAKDFLGESPFLMYLGDNLLSEELDDFLREFVDSGFPASITLTRVQNPSAYGIVEIDSHGNVVRLLEKPKNPPSNLAIVGIYAFTRRIFDAISRTKPSARGELEITDAIQKLCEDGENINYRIIKGWWEDTGTVQSLLDANLLVLSSLKPSSPYAIPEGVVVKGNVEIGEGTVFGKNTVIIGPVSIGSNCSIGPNAFIGPYASVGNTCTIKNAQVISSIILENTIVDCSEQIVFSIIGKNCVITSDSAPNGVKKTTLAVGDDTTLKV